MPLLSASMYYADDIIVAGETSDATTLPILTMEIINYSPVEHMYFHTIVHYSKINNNNRKLMV